MRAIFLFIAFCFLFVQTASAFRPVAHVILKNKVTDSLPEGNMFKKAMQMYPKIAAWGAVGPDLGYNLDNGRFSLPGWKRRIKNSWQLADVAHYNRVGTFVKNLVKEAKRANDPRFTAFVGGWITHIAGDFGSHGHYVKPEAGYYICNEEGRELHGELEKLADAYLFNKYAGEYCLSPWNFQIADYWEYFFGVPDRADNMLSKKEVKKRTQKVLGDSLIDQFTRVYQQTYDLKKKIRLLPMMTTYYRALGEGLGKIAGFSTYRVIDALEKLNKERRERIENAFELSRSMAFDYLVAADRGDTSIFNDEWNLDIGPKGGPNYVIRIDPRNRLIARTKNRIYLQFENNSGMVSPRQMLNTKIGFMKFAFYQRDPYYYHVNMGGGRGELNCWNKKDIRSIRLVSMRRSLWFSNVFRIKRIVLYYNGEVISEMKRIPVQKKSKVKNKKIKLRQGDLEIYRQESK